MKKRSFLKLPVILSLIALMGCGKAANEDWVEITFKIEGGQFDTVSIYRITPYFEVLKDEQRVVLDSLGVGQVSFYSPQPTFVDIKIGEESYPTSLLLQTSKGITIKGKKDNLLNTVEVFGKGAVANNYKIGTRRIEEENYQVDGLYFFQLDSAAFFQLNNKLKSEITAYTSAYFTDHHLSENLIQLLTNESRLISQYYLMNYYLVHSSLKRIEPIAIPWDTALYNMGSNTYYAALGGYQDLEIVGQLWNDSRANESELVQEEFPQMVFNKIQEANMPELFREHFIAGYLYADHLIATDITAASNDVMLKFRERYPNSKFMAAMDREYEKTQKLSSGTTAPEIKAISLIGDSLFLSDLRGKVVYIDVWATWCRSCIEELPETMALEKEFAENDGVRFLYLSVEKNIGKWKNDVEAMKLNGLHVNSSQSTFNQDYLISYVPRYILIDKIGKIANIYAPRPSSQKIRNEILDLL